MAASAKSLSALLAQTSIDDPEEYLKAANAAIKKSKSDLEAQHTKLVALLKLDRHEDALKVLNDVPQLQERARFEHAYALYISGDAAKAVEVAAKGDDSRAMKHVLAQSAYRSEDFEQAARAYRELSEQNQAGEEADIRINSGAVDAQLEWAELGHLAHTKKPDREDLQAFETAYNAACGSVSRGELGQAEICLKRAKDLCNALTDLSDAEKQAELLPITVQQVYVLTQLGRVDEAEQLSTTIPFAEIKELSTRYVAQVNSIAASKEHSNPYLSHRLFHASPKPPITDQHFSFQSNVLRQDEYVVDLLVHKSVGVAQSTAKLIASTPAPTTSPSINTAAVINAAAHSRNMTEKAALKAILPLLEKRPTDVGLLLTITHLYLLTNNPAAATHLLESFFKRLEQSGSSSDLDVRNSPGLVATLVSLYSQQGRFSTSKTELAKAASYWRHKSKTGTSKSLMVAAGTALLDTHSPESLSAAADIFTKLHEQDSTDRAANAGLVAAYSLSTPERLSSELLDSIPQAERLVADIDAAALEAAGIPTLAPSTVTTTESRKRSAPKDISSKAKRIRKSKMPKDFDPDKKMDPERWLPMRDRSYYKPKGKKGKKKLEGLTQGGPVVEEKVTQEGKQAAAAGGGQKKGGKKKGKGGGKW
ncbi:signal recognition particle protein-like protein [Lophiostoma macrostomum CBS 122681]|uniref:Signal recognition particle subunit SRP72 n=1 Tax=Lophiostoma macrostomum CBS 122681 TaxID=1314788 RepID=A0A6A6T071_9PLEO|nr:signal recognition particle protein-like protein [Lophiostoma macrostomum CBS 122681]